MSLKLHPIFASLKNSAACPTVASSILPSPIPPPSTTPLSPSPLPPLRLSPPSLPISPSLSPTTFHSKNRRPLQLENPIQIALRKHLPTFQGPVPPPPREGTFAHIFLDARVLKSLARGDYPLLTAFLKHPRRRCYYSPSVKNIFLRDYDMPIADFIRPATTKVPPLDTQRALETATENCKGNRYLCFEYQSVTEELLNIIECSVSEPIGYDPERDAPPYLLSCNMSLFSSYLSHEHNTRMLANAIHGIRKRESLGWGVHAADIVQKMVEEKIEKEIARERIGNNGSNAVIAETSSELQHPDLKEVDNAFKLTKSKGPNLIPLYWAQDLGLLNQNQELVEKVLTEGPYAGISSLNQKNFPDYWKRAIQQSGMYNIVSPITG